VSLAQLRPIWSRYPCVSLQVGRERAQLAGTPVLDVLPEHPAYADRAALIMALRCCVTVDTSCWHLAGGLGAVVHLGRRALGLAMQRQIPRRRDAQMLHRNHARVSL
jgi:hypothetical protein